MVKFQPDFERRHPRIARIVAIVALVNLGLVFFNLSYLNLRQVYRHYLPGITRLYDPVKGIQTHPETEYYQAEVDQLKAQLAQTGVQSPQVEESLLELRQISQRLIGETAFVGANGEYALAAIQQSIRTRTGETFAVDAFNRFWSSAYLSQQGWPQELAFWDAQVRPLLQSNYLRRTNSLGVPVDYFWLIDLPFILVFAGEILTRLLSMRRHSPELTWLDITLRRWYDVFLLLPFWRSLRLIPVTLRWYQVGWLDLEPVKAEAQRDTVVVIGADLAGIVGIQLIEQMQASIRNGDWLDWLAADGSSQDASVVEAMNQHEMSAIADQLYDTSVHHILPRIQPDIEELVQHSLTNTLENMPGYPQLNLLPGLERVSTRVMQQLSSSVVQGVYTGIRGSLLDTEGQEITARLQRNLRDAIAEELRQHNTLHEIQSRLINVLENIKLNYVKAIAEAGGEELANRTEQLRRQIS